MWLSLTKALAFRDFDVLGVRGRSGEAEKKRGGKEALALWLAQEG